ncbi:hypothetical protein [Mycobacteroides abscessus]|nr:hypothetical protein [Mycobacteroides abscessus]MDM3940797.1 hypothetical protein [Mycobacteroides abscessus]MDO3056772.1 hypothetical protein [Mycobacteroides abscessus subsp. massiliense]
MAKRRVDRAAVDAHKARMRVEFHVCALRELRDVQGVDDTDPP